MAALSLPTTPQPGRSRDPVVQYLARYAEAGTTAIAQTIARGDHRFDEVLVIPAFREGPDFFLRLQNTLLAQRACLLTLVVNQPDTEPAADADNSALWRAVCAVTTAVGAPFTAAATHCALRSIGSSDSAVLLVDRFDRGAKLPAREGVGRARKIGADIALALIAASVVDSRWIHSGDADAHLPLDYFFAVPKAAAAVAGVLPFRHRCGDDAVGAATRLYELSLEYHVAGLRWAASPYGFHSVGSTLVVRADAYAQVRGFPRRAGGEDFYLLNKLAKIGDVASPTAPVIELDARASTRVPFGTGPAVARLVSRLEAGEDLAGIALFHHPEVFRQLKLCLAAWPQIHRNEISDTDISPQSRDALAALGFAQALSHARRHSRSETQFVRQLNTWFDGFRTLKFLHSLRDRGWPQIDLATARTAPFFSAQ